MKLTFAGDFSLGDRYLQRLQRRKPGSSAYRRLLEDPMRFVTALRPLFGGDRIGIVGVNGGGKTTLLEVLTGIEPPDSGRITLDGVDVTTLSRRQRRARSRLSAVIQMKAAAAAPRAGQI